MQQTMEIRDITVDTVIGINDAECMCAMPLKISVLLNLDLLVAAHTDQLVDALDYRQVQESIKRHLSGRRFNLMETVARDVWRLCFVDPRVNHAEVTIEKQAALIGSAYVVLKLGGGRDQYQL